MNDYQSQSHTKWECKYHVVFIPKCRRKALFEALRREIGTVFRELARQKECKVEEGHVMPDHVHMMLSVPPKYSVSQVVGYIKGKSAIHIAREYGGGKRKIEGEHFLARGDFVSTVGGEGTGSRKNTQATGGRDETVIRKYIQDQEAEDKRLDQLKLW